MPMLYLHVSQERPISLDQRSTGLANTGCWKSPALGPLTHDTLNPKAIAKPVYPDWTLAVSCAGPAQACVQTQLRTLVRTVVTPSKNGGSSSELDAALVSEAKRLNGLPVARRHGSRSILPSKFTGWGGGERAKELANGVRHGYFERAIHRIPMDESQ
jgi:hypothetical protein